MIAPLRRGWRVLLAGLLLAGCASEEEIAATRDALDRLETDLLEEHPELIVRLREAGTQEFHGTRDVFGDQVVDDRELEARFGPRDQG